MSSSPYHVKQARTSDYNYFTLHYPSPDLDYDQYEDEIYTCPSKYFFATIFGKQVFIRLSRRVYHVQTCGWYSELYGNPFFRTDLYKDCGHFTDLNQAVHRFWQVLRELMLSMDLDPIQGELFNV